MSQNFTYFASKYISFPFIILLHTLDIDVYRIYQGLYTFGEFSQYAIDIESPKIDCLRFVYVPATSAAHNSLLFCFFFAAAVYSTNEENTRC
jgi:hypothetical protein